MSRELARKYRPGNWADFTGQRPAVWMLYRMAVYDDLASAIMLYGERGCGKTSMARVIAKSLNCEGDSRKPDQWPCGSCPSCKAVDAGASVDVDEIDAASNGDVATMRELRQRASYGPSGRRRVFIIDEGHAASEAAFQAMLKPFEEPADGVTFIIVTTRPDKVPSTVRSRCDQFLFTPLEPAVITARLEQICAAEGFEAGPGLLAAIAEAADGGMRDAIVGLDQAMSARLTDLARWREFTGITDFAPALLNAAADGNYPVMRETLRQALGCGDPGRVTARLVQCLADVLDLTVPGRPALPGEGGRARAELAARLGAERAMTAVEVLWTLQAKIRTGDPKSDLLLALSMISKRLSPPAAAAARPIPPAESSSRATIDQLREELGASSGSRAGQ